MTRVTIPINDTLEFAASGQLEDLRLVELDRPIWKSSDRRIIDVTQEGVATARTRGKVVIRVRDRHSDVVGTVEVEAGP